MDCQPGLDLRRSRVHTLCVRAQSAWRARGHDAAVALRHHQVMTSDGTAPRPAPLDLIEGALGRVEQIRERPADPPGNEWNFALGVLFALSATDQLDGPAVERFEARIQAEARRLRGETS